MSAAQRHSDVHRVRAACLILQIVLGLWLLRELHGRTQELIYHLAGFHASLINNWIRPIAYTFCLLAMLVVLLNVSKRINKAIPFVGAAVIFNYILLRLLQSLLWLANACWSRWYGEKLVASDPFSALFPWFPEWIVDAIWLILIFSGIAMAVELNTRFGQHLVTRRQLRVLSAWALIGWALWVIWRHAGGTLMAPLEAVFESGGMTAGLIAVTTLLLIILAPAAVFSYMAILALHRIRQALVSDPERRPCDYCGYDLRGIKEGNCPECGRAIRAT